MTFTSVEDAVIAVSLLNNKDEKGTLLQLSFVRNPPQPPTYPPAAYPQAYPQQFVPYAYQPQQFYAPPPQDKPQLQQPQQPFYDKPPQPYDAQPYDYDRKWH